MRFLSWLFLLGCLLSLSGCKEDTVTPTAFFGRQWFNTFEQDQAGFFTFRLENKAQGWRYDGFRLDADGRFVEYGLGPADGPEERPGTWTETGRLTYQIRFANGQRQGYTLQVQLLDDDAIKAHRTY